MARPSGTSHDGHRVVKLTIDPMRGYAAPVDAGILAEQASDPFRAAGHGKRCGQLALERQFDLCRRVERVMGIECIAGGRHIALSPWVANAGERYV